MSSEQAAPIAQCAECGRVWPANEGDRWEAYLTDDEPPELASFCPDCAEREFKSSAETPETSWASRLGLRKLAMRIACGG